jgi:hypothetical protein
MTSAALDNSPREALSQALGNEGSAVLHPIPLLRLFPARSPRYVVPMWRSSNMVLAL